MALSPCPECKKEISDRAAACPQCGVPIAPAPRPGWMVGGAVVVALAVIGGATYLSLRPSDYERTELLRAEQDELGTHNDDVRQRFFRLYKEHPNDAVYVYLWARCVDDAAKQLELAQEGMRANPRYSWNYNVAARDLARLNKVREGYELALQGAAIDPANIPLNEKVVSLKRILDNHLDTEAKPAPTPYTTYDSKESFDKGAVRYKGLFHGQIKSPDHADLQAIKKSRLPAFDGAVSEVVRGFNVCANRFADACIRVYVPVDAKFEPAWQHTTTDVAALDEDRLVSVAGSVIANGHGEDILLADSVTAEGQ